jgi:putative tryptophan/tyrosine transport system substrate-binding protein
VDRRRFLVTSLAGAVAGPVASEAQHAKVPRIGVLGNGTSLSMSPQLNAFRQGLGALGWIDGQTVMIEYRWAEGQPDRFPTLAAELVQLKVDVIVLSGPPALRAVQQATRIIPIVFVSLADPVAAGFVASLARPGGNMTGLASQYEELITKQLQLLAEAIPTASRVALLQHRDSWPVILSAAETAARGLALTPRTIKVEGVEFENAFKAARNERVGAIQVLPSPIFNAHRKRLIELAARYHLPAVYEFHNYVEDGGLMSYGPSVVEMFRGMAKYIDRILRGAKPAELPIERPTIFELVINLRTAKVLGLTIPPSLLARADQVID